MEFLSFKKICIFGSERVGKTTLVSRIENKNFTEEAPSTSSNYLYN